MISSVRARVTFVATAAVAIVLTIASFAILQLVEGDLLDSAERAVIAELELEAAAFDFEEELERAFDFDGDSGVLTLGAFVEIDDELLTGGLFEDGARLVDLVIDPVNGELIEVYDPYTFETIDDHQLLELIESLAFEALVIDRGDEEGREFFVGAAARDEVDESLQAVRGALLIMVPVLVVLLGGLIWWLVGRALKPVAAITEQVGAISTTSLDRRVPVSNGEDEISDLATVMNDMLSRLERGDKRQRQFAADASHELRSPLATVRVAGELLEKPVGDTRRSELAEAIVAESDRMDALIGDLLELSRIDEDDTTKSFTTVALSSVIAKVCDGRGRVNILSSPPIDVRGDQRQIARAVTNLVDNALRHADSQVQVSTAQSSAECGRVRIVVEDDGPGVAEEQREIIFERFSRLDGARDRSSGGSGLGLALVRAIAQRHAGSIVVDRSPELGGARFVLTLGQAL